VTTVRDAPPRHKRAASARRSRHNAIVDLALALGTIVVAAVVLGAIAHLSFVEFRSGSMAPEYPTGTVALVRDVPASDVHVGDVVTVDRAGQLPITHRVVAAATGRDGITTLRLRGDANAAADPKPYRVSDVRLVEASMPDASRTVAIVGGVVIVVGLLALSLIGLASRRRRIVA